MNIDGYNDLAEVIRSDGYTLYRGTDPADGSSVLVKAFAEPADAERDFAILSSFEIEGLAAPRELHTDDGNAFVVLDDLPGRPISSIRGSERTNLAALLDIASEIARLIGDLHKAGFVAAALDPDSILFDIDSRSVGLADLSNAVRTSPETGSVRITPADELPFAYLAPEMTGRVAREADHRADLYSAGAVLYELFTGSPPFEGTDPLELMHRHVTAVPDPPEARSPGIPPPLSRIILKLLEKQPENRYQSAAGLRRDLETVAEGLLNDRDLRGFEPATDDVSDKFIIPKKLYGRESESEELRVVFDRSCEGPPGLMLIGGYSGIGKTSLVTELGGPIRRTGGNFITGKFDQVARGIPFGALIQAIRELVARVLTFDDEELSRWQAAISDAVGNNGAVLTEVIPELEMLIGIQPPSPPVPPQETLNRLQLVFQKFLAAVSTPDHPLVIFLDDLQWADAATLGLLHPLMKGTVNLRHFLLIGAYRDNEVDVSHPLSRTIRELNSAGVELHKMNLGPLNPADIERLTADALQSRQEQTKDLASLVFEKTGGNPFFVNQFLKTLRRENLIRFDYDQWKWTYDIGEMERSEMTDNVIDLMTRKISSLPPGPQRAMKLASCIGNRFSVVLLAVISGESEESVLRDLVEASAEGLLVELTGESGEKTAGNYRFLHDRVQQAAQEMLSPDKRSMVHLTVGRLLASTYPDDKFEEELFDVVNHLNLGRSLITGIEELLKLAGLNLRAGTKAKSTGAFEAARTYFETGAGILSEIDAPTDSDLRFTLSLEAAECAYLCGDLDEDGSVTERLLGMATDRGQRARVLNLCMVRYENQALYHEAIATARECLELFGVGFPDSQEEKERKLEAEISGIEGLLQGRPIRSIVEIPEMEDPGMRMVLNILTDIWSPTYITGDEVLARLISATIVRISLTHGISAETAYGCVTHAITVGPVLGDFEAALEYGRLALAINERFDDARRRAKIHQQFHAHVALWRMPYSVCVEHAREATRSGLESGDFLYGSYGAMTETWSAFPDTADLAEYIDDYLPNLELIRKLRVNSFADAHRLMLNWASALMGETDSPTSLSNIHFDEGEYARIYEDNVFFSTFLSIAKLDLYYSFGEIEKAFDEYHRASGLAKHLSGTIWPVFLDKWGGLTLIAVSESVSGEEKAEMLAEAQGCAARLEVLAENCEHNYLIPSLLLNAELARVAGRDADAVEAFERACEFTDAPVRERALASELFGAFWAARGRFRLATACFDEAAEHYSTYGATAKLEDMRTRYGRFASHLPGQPTTAGETLDAASVIKAAQALAEVLDLDQLVETLVKIVAENAGAERAVLFLEEEGVLKAVAEHAPGEAAGLADERVPHTLINYCHRTLETVVIHNAGRGTPYEADPYLTSKAPLSAMVMALTGRGSMKGILYLENSVVSGAFTEDRVRICGILASQATVPLENASLYRTVKTEADQRRLTEETLRSVTEGTASLTGGSFFESLVCHLAEAFRAKYALITDFRKDTNEALILAYWKVNELVVPGKYEVSVTPCAKVVEGETIFFDEGVKDLFPKDTALMRINAEGYWGVPLRDSSGEVIGHLAVMDDKPMNETEQGRSLLEIFASRAGAELERLYAERQLQSALEELKQLKDRLEDENVYLREEIRQSHNFQEVVGESPALLKALKDVERVAPTTATVLVTGETGTGKELIARAVHERSERKGRPLVKVNCAAISAGLVESELFGHTKGAFTGAVEKRSGRFELADGGTIFLDEVGELPPDTQVKILRVLQEGEFEPVGSSKTVKVDVRVIAATNRDLETEIAEGRFRSDLFYRLNVFPIAVPALRERSEDVPALVMFFLERYCKAFGKPLLKVPRGVMRALGEYSWPGNIRELQNLIERAVVLAPADSENLTADLIPVISGGDPGNGAYAESTTAGAIGTASRLEDIEREHILSVLDLTNWTIAGDDGAANILDLHPNTLRSRMKKLGIKRPNN